MIDILLFGHEVGLKKMKVFYLSAHMAEYYLSHITIGWAELKAVKQFAYLGSTISSDMKVDKEIGKILMQIAHSADYVGMSGARTT